ncbi:MAG: sugar ABC transporter substrate-binding protein [Proteobacteria bacterium]|nr:sugar ABC transporter substrate-binding protein [Pseudomonadota bacterium]
MSPRIAVFTKNLVNPGYQSARIGADRTAARLGATVTHYVPQKPDNVDEQIALIEQAVREKPDAVVFVPVHETAVNDAILQFDAAHIPLFNIVSRTTAGQRVCFVGSDDRALGRDIARYLFDKLSGRGDIVIIEGAGASPTSRDRLLGFQDTLRSVPGITVRASLRGEYLREVAKKAWLEAADKLNGIDAVLSANDHMVLGVIDAMTELGLGKIPPMVGINAIPDAIVAIEAGRMLATANFDPMAMSAIAVEAAIRHLEGERVPAEVILPVQIIDAGNCAAWNKPYEARPLPVWDEVMKATMARPASRL